MPVVRVALPVPLHTLFDYLPPAGADPPGPGDRVLVPFGNRRMIGLVCALSETSDLDRGALKPVLEVLDRGLVPPDLMALLAWTTRYYLAPPGELVSLALPAALRRTGGFRTAPPDWVELSPAGREADFKRAPARRAVAGMLGGGARARSNLLEAGIRPNVLRRMLDEGQLLATDGPAPPARPGPQLNPGQRAAVDEVVASMGRFEAFLLAGVTGSGKTEVYLQAAREALRCDRQVLVLIPEIGLTPQLVRRVEARLGLRVRVYHSGLAEGERLAAWQAARDGSARVLVGTRSSVFLPLAEPGLIVVDEEHDGSYKQQDAPRYHGRDVAVMRARMLGIPIVLGSATPSLESLHNLDCGRYRRLELPRRAGQAELPAWRVEDLRGRKSVGGLTPELLEAVGGRLKAGEQVLIYRNRRGYAPVLICDECGWQGDCERCSAHLTWHRADGRLICHHCGRSELLPARCPGCGSPRLAPRGAGTERLESLLAERFPDARILRVDRDSMSRRDDFERLLEQVAGGEPCILVGTQMLAKGHHFPGITLAVVLDADQALYSADFRAPERLAQAVFQVAGRAGRGERGGRFILQTRHPEHPLIRELAAGSYLKAAGGLLSERLSAGLPPGRALALVRAEAHQPEAPRNFLVGARKIIERQGLECNGPLPAILARRSGYWRYQLWVECAERAALSAGLNGVREQLSDSKDARKVRWHLDMDPQEL